MKAYMSYLNLLTNNANFEKEGKLAALWFDKLLLGINNELVEKVIENVAEKEMWGDDVLKEVKKIQISSEGVFPKIGFTDDILIEDDKYIVAMDILQDKYKKEILTPNMHGQAMHEVIMGGAGITSAVKYWTLLNSKERCTYLPIDIERQFLNRIFGNVADAGYNNFSNIITCIIPDVSQCSWNEIIEIRHHNYWLQFRKKMTDLSDSISDEKLNQEILEEIIRKDLIEMAQHFRPQTTKNIIKGVVSNIPLPIPVNPMSIVFTGESIMNELDFQKKYGWIYFYLDNKK